MTVLQKVSKACHCLYQLNSDQTVCVGVYLLARVSWHYRVVFFFFFSFFFVVPSTLKMFLNNLLMGVFENVCNLRHILIALFFSRNHIGIKQRKSDY